MRITILNIIHCVMHDIYRCGKPEVVFRFSGILFYVSNDLAIYALVNLGAHRLPVYILICPSLLVFWMSGVM